jgi:hypothetical protein
MSAMDGDDGTYCGTLLGESIQPGMALDGIPLTATKVRRAAAGDAAAGQPELWTFIEFRVAADRAAELADALSRVLNRDGGWYCDFHSADEVFVVFHGRVFRYQRGDQSGRARAEEHARAMGVPEAQLDWPG